MAAFGLAFALLADVVLLAFAIGLPSLHKRRSHAGGADRVPYARRCANGPRTTLPTACRRTPRPLGTLAAEFNTTERTASLLRLLRRRLGLLGGSSRLCGRSSGLFGGSHRLLGGRGRLFGWYLRFLRFVGHVLSLSLSIEPPLTQRSASHHDTTFRPGREGDFAGCLERGERQDRREISGNSNRQRDRRQTALVYGLWPE